MICVKHRRLGADKQIDLKTKTFGEDGNPETMRTLCKGSSFAVQVEVEGAFQFVAF